MTPEEFLQKLIEDSNDKFKNNIRVGDGMDLEQFLKSKAAAKPAAYISYGGYNEIDTTEDGKDVEDAESYYIYLLVTDSAKPFQKAIRRLLLEQGSEFTDDEGKCKYVSMPNGQAYRENGLGAFAISVIIK